jgi:zinc transporter ZupT
MATNGHTAAVERTRLTRMLLALSIAGMALSSAPVEAHSPGATTGDAPFGVVLGLSAAVGGGAGALAVYWRWDRLSSLSGHLTHGRVSGLIGTALVGLGVLFVLPAARREPAVVPIGLLFGGVVVYSILRYRDPAMSSFIGDSAVADTVLGAVWLHRLVEGVALAAAYRYGVALGVAAAVVLTAHIAVEMAAVGGLYATAGARLRGLVAVILVQLSYVLAAGVTAMEAVSIAPTLDAFVLVAAGGVLFFLGIYGCQTCVSPAGAR